VSIFNQNIYLSSVRCCGLQANKNNLLIFAAVGNAGLTDQPSYPAAEPNVFAITAIDAAQRPYQHANQGDYVDFAAPGVDIWTISPTGQAKYRSGTSYASPYAMALATVFLMQNKTFSRDEIYNAIKASTYDLGDAGHDKQFGWGLVQLTKHDCTKAASE
jgi:subtilisin family serine protease